jgi:predicted RNA-binding protein with TRAM domain
VVTGSRPPSEVSSRPLGSVTNTSARQTKDRRGGSRLAIVTLAAVFAIFGVPSIAFASPIAPTTPSNPIACPTPAPGQVQCFAEIAKSGGVTPFDTTPSGLSPATIDSVYGFSSATDGGTGQTIGIVDASNDPTAASDLAAFSAQFGLPSCTVASGCFSQVGETGGSTPSVYDQGWSVEISLDIEWVHAVAPNAHILLVEATTPGWSDMGAAETYAVSHASYVSNSWGAPDFPGEAASDSYFVHPGTSVFVASGDYAAVVEYPSSSPDVVAVGGTTLGFSDSGALTSETAWVAGGGGCSQYEMASSAQAGFSQYAASDCNGQRATPDLSADADPNSGASVYDSNYSGGSSSPWIKVGGTSLATPIVAAAAADTGQQVNQTAIYNGSMSFRDITSGYNGPGTSLADTWTGTGTAWTQASPSSSPGTRAYGAMAYDTSAGTMVLFGGIDSNIAFVCLCSYLNDTWTWDGATWTQADDSSDPGCTYTCTNSPPDRRDASLTYDAATGDIVLFGGVSGPGTLFNDTWDWDGTVWTQVDDSGDPGCTSTCTNSPPARLDATMAYDTGTANVVLFGGDVSDVGSDNDTWIWNGTTWTEVAPSVNPEVRWSATMAFDSTTGEMVLFGGVDGGAGVYLSDTWNWNGTTWTEASPLVSPGQRENSVMTFDATTGDIVLFGGQNGSTYFDDTWSWSGTSWTHASSSSSPSPRYMPAMAYDPETSNVLLYGGAAVNDASAGYDTATGQGSWVNQVQSSPTSGTATVSNSASFNAQLNTEHTIAPSTYAVTTPAAGINVSSSGAITTTGTLTSGTYSFSGTSADAYGNTIPWSFALTVSSSTISQTTPTTGFTVANTTFSGQLAVSGSHGTLIYVQATGTPDVSVSSSGAVSASDTLAPNGYSASGTVSDSYGDTGTWTFDVTVSAGPITQTTPTTGTVQVGDPFSSQLDVSGSYGSLTYSQSTGSPHITVSSAGAISAPDSLATGVYTASGTDSDSDSDSGTWSFSLAVYNGTISGTVTAASGGAPIDGICVTAELGGSGVETQQTAGGGTFALSGLAAGSYVVYFWSSGSCVAAGSYLNQYYNNETQFGSANLVIVSTGSTVSGVNAALQSAGTITGTVTAASNGDPLSGICITAVDPDSGDSYGGVTTASDGTYLFDGLPTGSYAVEFAPGCGNSGTYLGQWYSDQTTAAAANMVTVNAGSTTPFVNAAMLEAGTITGTVTDAIGGGPVAGVCVYITTSYTPPGFYNAVTASDGTYSIPNLAAGSYRVEFASGCGNPDAWTVQWYNNQSNSGSATLAVVANGSTTSAVNAALIPNSTISGTVTAAIGGAPLVGMCVNETQITGGTSSGYAITQTGGTYSLTGLSAGTYTIEFTPGCGNSGNYADQWYDAAISSESADLVSVAEGGTTGSVNAAMQAPAAPSAPTVSAVTPGNGSVTITWDLPSSAGTSPITGYQIVPYIGGSAQTPIIVGDTLSHAVSGLINGTTYTFTVEAVNDVGSGAASAASSPVTPATVPDAPVIGVVSAGNADATVSWTAPVHDGGAAVSDYLVYANGGYVTDTIAAGCAPSCTSLAVTGLTNGDTYVFTVEAVNDVGSGAASAASSPVTPATVPDAPVIGVVSAGNADATVSWTAPVHDGGAAVSDYLVYANGGYVTDTIAAGCAPSCTSLAVTGLTNGDTYVFTVEAVNDVGSGAASAASSPVTPATVPDEPTGLTAVPGNLSVQVRWIAPASDGGSPITGYQLITYKNGVLQGVATLGNITSQDVTGLAGGAAYTFAIAATNADGTGAYSATTAPAVPELSGYWMVASDGGIFAFGDAGFYGSTGAISLNKAIVGMASTPDGKGYWMVASDGGIFAFGDAGFYGSTGAISLNKAIVGMASTPDGKGYWMVASDGGIFAFGDAGFYGSTGADHLNKPIVGMASTPDGKGYWMVASDGGIFAFGDAGFYGSTGADHLNKPIVGMASTPDGKGYWMVASDGGIFAFGDAGFYGSTGADHLNKPIVGMASTPDGKGYWMVASDGGIFAFGDAGFFGSTGAMRLNKPIVGASAV